MCETRETREGRPLLTVETDANRDSKSANERRCPAMAGSFGSSCGYKRFSPALAALVGPVQNVFFPHQYTISVHLSTSPSKLGKQ